MTMQLDYIAVGERIRQMRRDRGLTQEQLAEACGLSASFIGHIERGTRIMSVDTLYQLSLQLKISTDFLLLDSAGMDSQLLQSISAILKTKDKKKVNIFLNTVKILADKIDEM